MLYLPFETTRKDLVFPRGTGGNFIMYQLNIDTYSGVGDIRCDINNEYYFDHTTAYKYDDEVVIPFYEFLSNNLELIETMYESSQRVTKWSEGWAIEDLYNRVIDREFSVDTIRDISHQHYTRIANKAVTGSVLFSTRLHNKIISRYKTDGIITCAHHTPSLYSFLQTDMRNKEYRDYLNNDINYHYALITVDKGIYYDYICQLRSIKHGVRKFNFGEHSYESEIEIFPRLFPNCVQFDWKVLFVDQDKDLWEELFDYFDKIHVWNEYKDIILKNISDYTRLNDFVIDNAR